MSMFDGATCDWDQVFRIMRQEGKFPTLENIFSELVYEAVHIVYNEWNWKSWGDNEKLDKDIAELQNLAPFADIYGIFPNVRFASDEIAEKYHRLLPDAIKKAETFMGLKIQ